MIALVDADITSYWASFASVDRDEGTPLSTETLISFIDGKIEEIKNNTSATSVELYLTGKGNFRENIAKERPYKDKRSAKPFHLKNARAYLESLGAVTVDGMEADDMLAIRQTELTSTNEDGTKEYNSVIVTSDKDLHMVEGWHHFPEQGRIAERPLRIITKEEGDRNFFLQCLTGDPVDTIPGLPGIGPAKAKKFLEGCEGYDQLLERVKEVYRDLIGTGWEDYLLEQGQLLWMVRELDKDGKPVMWSF